MAELLKNKLLWLVAAVVVIGGGIWIATSGGEKELSLNKEIQQKCMTEVNDDLFCKFAGAFGNANSFKVEATSTSDQGASSYEISTDAKDNNQMVVKQNGQEQFNVVTYNGTTYLKDYTDGQWIKYASNDPNKPEVADFKKEFAKGNFKSDSGQKITYTKIGTEACGSLQCYKYQVKDPDSPGDNFLYFDTKDYLLRRITLKGSTSSTEMTVNYAAVNITEPSPTKEAPSLDAGTTE
ncbi:hypothetical protein A3F65_01200 [Candidatus Saccharibacteria bacterium RIFCSPHIGHO2_12_FULL_47_16b]|nr:MAG: hypothetical protein A3F65_01200 [Candidatus Saccharibacteria bacterium RIFCSPHIGHO2_12_FULL_47_16b]